MHDTPKDEHPLQPPPASPAVAPLPAHARLAALAERSLGPSARVRACRECGAAEKPSFCRVRRCSSWQYCSVSSCHMVPLNQRDEAAKVKDEHEAHDSLGVARVLHPPVR